MKTTSIFALLLALSGVMAALCGVQMAGAAPATPQPLSLTLEPRADYLYVMQDGTSGRNYYCPTSLTRAEIERLTDSCARHQRGEENMQVCRRAVLEGRCRAYPGK